jgi:CubicO group peptidase (beta-lactamase class C family)
MMKKEPVIVIRKIGLILSVVYFVFSGCSKDEIPVGPQINSLEEEVDFILEKYIKVGAMVGIINKQQEKLILSYGIKSVDNDEPPDANSVFEIGSITKTFTTILAADMYLKGNIPDDTVSHYLPAGQVKMPSSDGVEISFVHLATHSSGIPRNPRGTGYPYPAGYDPFDPYAAYTTEHIYEYLTSYCTLEFVPGTWWLYSNTGMGLLGHVLGLIDGTSYESALKRYVLDVLGMESSSLSLTEQQMNNLAVGHDADRNIVQNWNAQDIFQGCGFIKSTLNDMFQYLEANLGLIETPLRDAIDLTHQPQFHQGSLGDIGLAWYILELDDGQVIIYHGGGTGGYDSYIGLNRSLSTGVIVLFNSKVQESVLVIGERLLRAINKY